MRRGKMMIVSAAALALASCGPKAETTTTTTTTNVMTDNSAMAVPVSNSTAPVASAGQTFANTAAASDAFEIATSQLAATNAKSPTVKSFAAKMIEAHTGSTAKLKTAAASASPAITPDATMTTEQQKKLADLKAMTGVDFDAAYASDQVDAHQATLDAVKAYSASGDVPALKTFASGLVPAVAAHLNMAKGLKN